MNYVPGSDQPCHKQGEFASLARRQQPPLLHHPIFRGRRLRAQSTPPEAELWQHLRAKRFGGFKFRHRLGPDFADRCGIERRLIIELDGGQHAEQQEQEAARTAYLTAQGYRVIRFWHEQVNRALDDVLEAIYAGLTDSESRAWGRRAGKGPSLGAKWMQLSTGNKQRN